MAKFDDFDLDVTKTAAQGVIQQIKRCLFRHIKTGLL